MVHTKTRLSAEQANMGETKAWQPTDKLTKDIDTTAIQDEMMMMIHVDNLKKGRGSFDVPLGCILPVITEMST